MPTPSSSPALRDTLDRQLLALLQTNARESAVRLNALLDDIRNLDGVVKTTTSVALAWKIERAGVNREMRLFLKQHKPGFIDPPQRKLI